MPRTTIHDDDKKGNGKARKPPAEPVRAVEQAFPKAEGKFESGRDAFIRIAAGRVNAILERLGTLAKLASGKARYGYSDADIEHIRKTLITNVNAACDRLLRKPVKGDFSFHRDSDAGA